MKTKIFALFTLLTLCLGACSAGAAPAMYIQPAELNEEEEAVAKLLGADTSQHLYDIVLDGTARKISVRVYELIGGEWESFSGGGGPPWRRTTKRAGSPSALRTCGKTSDRPSSSERTAPR